MRCTFRSVVQSLFACALLALASPVHAGGPSEPRCERARDAEHLEEFPHITADHTFCEVGYVGVRLEGGPFSIVSLGAHTEFYLRNIVNVYGEFGLGFGSQTRDRGLGWVPAPFGRVYAGYPISWIKHRRNKRWVVDESINMTFGGGYLPNGTFMARLGMEFMVKRY